jgi:hypothetical protein
MTRAPVILGSLLLAALPAVAAAQAYEVKLGVGASPSVLRRDDEMWGRGTRGVGIDGRIQMRVSQRFAIEPFVSVGRRSIATESLAATVTGGNTTRTEGLYGAIVQQRLLRLSSPTLVTFITYGLAGTFERESSPALHYSGPGLTVDVPASTSSRLDGPVLIAYGGGIEKSLRTHLALRTAAEVISFFGYSVGVRGTVGLVYSLGPR